MGFWLWAGKVTGLSFGSQQEYIIIAGAGMGLMLGPANTDAVNRRPARRTWPRSGADVGARAD